LPQAAAKFACHGGDLHRAAANLPRRTGEICRGPRQLLLAMVQIYQMFRAPRQIKLAAPRGKFDLPRPSFFFRSFSMVPYFVLWFRNVLVVQNHTKTNRKR